MTDSDALAVALWEGNRHLTALRGTPGVWRQFRVAQITANPRLIALRSSSRATIALVQEVNRRTAKPIPPYTVPDTVWR
jgi:hypothetical protein